MVRYNHTPLHRTVAELGALFKPPSKQLGPGAQKLQKTPKRTQEQKAQDSEKRSGKKRRSTNALGETRKTPQKRKKLRSGISQTAALPAPETSPERLAALSDDRASCPAVPSDSNQLSGEESPQDRTVNDHSAAPVGEEPANTGQGSAESESSLALTLSVTAEEAARRRKVALVMLKDAGVDPNTLSADQFSIFANQSPGLQKESLNMLAQYGAARLRIVRPPNRECSTSAPPNSEPPRSPVIVTEGQSTTKELVPHNEALVEKSSKKRKSGDGATRVTSAGAATSSSPQTPRQSKRRPGKSRVACYSCKSQRVKVSVHSAIASNLQKLTSHSAPMKSRHVLTVRRKAPFASIRPPNPGKRSQTSLHKKQNGMNSWSRSCNSEQKTRFSRRQTISRSWASSRTVCLWKKTPNPRKSLQI